MSVLLSANGTMQQSSVNPIVDNSLTVGSGDSALVLMFANFSSGAVRGFSSAPTWAGTPLTLIDTITTTDNNFIAGFYGLVTPVSGNHTLSCPNNNGDTFGICAASFTGSGTLFGTAFGGRGKAVGSSGNPSVVISCPPNDQLLGVFFAEGTTQTISPNGHVIWSLHPTTQAAAGNNQVGGDLTNVSATLAVGGVNWAVMAMDIMVSVTDMMGQQCD